MAVGVSRRAEYELHKRDWCRSLSIDGDHRLLAVNRGGTQPSESVTRIEAQTPRGVKRKGGITAVTMIICTAPNKGKQ